MKLLNRKLVPVLLINLLSLGVTACGGAPTNIALPPPASPMMGYPGYGYNGQPVMGPGAGCYPITAPIPFSAQGGFNNGKTIKAGIIPPIPGIDPFPYEGVGNRFGTVLFGGMASAPALTTPSAPMGLMTSYSALITNRQEADGTLQVSVSMNPTTGATAFMSGMIAVSPAKAMIINATHGTGSMFTSTMPYFNSACVSAISLSMSYVYNGYGLTFNGGRVFLYLNGTAHGTWLQL